MSGMIKDLRSVLDPCFESLGFTPDPESFAHASYKGGMALRTIQVGCSARSRHQFVGDDNLSSPLYRTYSCFLTSLYAICIFYGSASVY